MANLVRKDVSYLGRDFGEFRKNLIDYTKQYFPQTYNDFNEASPGMMFVEMAAYVGDVLSYYTDYNLKENLLPNATETKNILSIANTLGYKAKNTIAASVNLDIFQLIPAKSNGTTLSPDWDYALIVQENLRVKSENGLSEFRTTEPIDFSYSSSLSPTEVTVYSVNDTTGEPEWYLLRKNVKAISGKINSVNYTFGAPKIYDKITLTVDNIIEIVDVTDSDNNKWYEVPYLAQDTIFESVQNTSKSDPELSQYRDSVPYLLKLKKTAKRFISTVKDNNRLEIQFGAGISEDADELLIPNPDIVGTALPGRDRLIDASIDPSNFLYTRTYGLAPANTTLTVRYTTGLGVNDNVAANSLTDVLTFSTILDESGLDNTLLATVKRSIATTNPQPARGGSDKESIEEIRNQALSNFSAQNRAVTKEDYIVRAYSLPPRFGAIAKAYIVQDDQLSFEELQSGQPSRVSNPFAMNMYLLGYDSSRRFTQLNQAVKENLKEYLSSYRMLTDAINIKDAYIINIGLEFEIVPLPNYNANEVILRCIAKMKTYFDNRKWQINQPIMLSQLRVELDKVDGVQTVKDVKIINKYNMNEGYSGNIYDIDQATKEGVVYPSLDPSIFEIKYLDKDIKGRSTGL
jgi:hypothetical protein